MKRIRLYLLVTVIGIAGAATARATDAGTPATTPFGTTMTAIPPASGIDWAKMSDAEKKKYMKTKVLPEAKKMFQAYDAKAFKKVTCETCHGPGVADGNFKMPNAKLPKLPKPTSRADFMELQKKKPDAVKFMGTVVKPTMAHLLNQPEWSPTEPKGFGCYHCHTHDE
ncbi:MAG TPA: hypothetical protein VHJ20_23020 [Polyangia bacterium]|nr:hypothetical protein [Polyangia bacterium]